MMKMLAESAVPITAAAIILMGYLRGVDIFDEFLKGAESGIKTSFDILPALVALITAIGVFSASGALDMLTAAVAPAARWLSLPAEVVPLALLRPVSGSGALAIFQRLLTQHGADSFIGRVASVMQGSTETTFYTVAVYFGAVSVKKTRHTVFAALLADITGFVMSVLFVKLFFY